MVTSLIFWTLESQNPKTTKCPRFGWFWLISMYGVFFQLTFCQETWFWTRNSKIQSFLEVSRNFRGFGKSSGLFFGQFQHMGHHFYSILVTEINFKGKISEFLIFLKMSLIFSGNMITILDQHFCLDLNLMDLIFTQL